jgi:hypothetical protein
MCGGMMSSDLSTFPVLAPVLPPGAGCHGDVGFTVLLGIGGNTYGGGVVGGTITGLVVAAPVAALLPLLLPPLLDGVEVGVLVGPEGHALVINVRLAESPIPAELVA